MISEKDKTIIQFLREDSRTSLRELAKKTKLRPSTLHQRIQKLKADGVISKFTIQVDPERVGEGFTAFLLIKGTTQNYITKKMLTDPRVKEVQGVTGEYDVLVKMKFEDVRAFNDYLISFRKNNPDIQSTLTMIGTATLKEEL